MILIMPRPTDAKYLAVHGQDDQGGPREAERPTTCRRSSSTRSRRSHLLERDPPRRPHDPGEDAEVRRASSPTGCATTRSGCRSRRCSKPSPRNWSRPAIPRARSRRSSTPITSSSRPRSSAPGRVSEAAAADVPLAARALGEAVEPDRYPDRRGDRARDPLQRDRTRSGKAPYGYGAGAVLLVLSLAMLQTIDAGLAGPAARQGRCTGLGHGRPRRRDRTGGLRLLPAGPDLGLGAGDQHVRDGHLGRAGGGGARRWSSS